MGERYRRRRSGLVFGLKTRRLARRAASARRAIRQVSPAGWPAGMPSADVGGGVTCGLLVAASTAPLGFEVAPSTALAVPSTVAVSDFGAVWELVPVAVLVVVPTVAAREYVQL